MAGSRDVPGIRLVSLGSVDSWHWGEMRSLEWTSVPGIDQWRPELTALGPLDSCPGAPGVSGVLSRLPTIQRILPCTAY